MDELRSAIVEKYEKELVHMRIQLKYTQANLISEIRKHALVVRRDYNESDLTLELRVLPGRATKVKSILREASTAGGIPAAI